MGTKRCFSEWRIAPMQTVYLETREEAAPALTAKRGPSSAHRKDIDGLRAIAVLSVLGFHCGIPWLRGGFIGVDIFFVISGYLICSIIYRDLQSGTFSIARFYERRFKRILPALFVVLAFCLVLAVLILSPVEARRLGNSALATALSASNFLFWRQSGYFDAGSNMKPLLMTWSLAVEEQFYFAFPLIMLMFRRMPRRSLLVILSVLCVLSLSLSLIAEFSSPSLNFYSPFTRAWELGAGTLLAIWTTGRSKIANQPSWKADATGAIGLLLIAVPIFWYLPGTRFPGYEAIPPVLGTILILASAGGRANRILSIPPLVDVGLISYSLYLWHWPLLSFARIISAHPLHARTTVILMAIAFAAATASYFLVEKPFRARTAVRTSTVLLAYASLLFAFVVVSGLFSLTHGLPGRAPELARIEFQANIDRGHPCQVSRLSALSSFCLPPANGTGKSFALLGDSHAEAISNRMRNKLANDGWQLVTISHGSCPPTLGMTRWISAEEADSCRRFNRGALNYVLSRPDIRVVALLAGWGGRIYVPDNLNESPLTQSSEQNTANLMAGVENEIAALESAGKRVILIDDYPEFPFDPVESIRYGQMPLRRALNRLFLSDEPEQWQSTSEDATLELIPPKRAVSVEFAALAKSDPRLALVSLDDKFCQDGRCSFADRSELYYFDADHLSDLGAMRVMPLFSKFVEGQ
jgi:peptidoglycan/LPS O-acetylase OafA/YrhL